MEQQGQKEEVVDDETVVDAEKPSNYYIDPEEFYREMVKFREDNKERVAAGLRPIIPESIGKKILLICNKLITRYNFSRYPFRDEMIDFAIENSVRYIWSFDPEQSRNPFSYFTRATYRSFVRVIKNKKKEMENLDKYRKHHSIFPEQNNEVDKEELEIRNELNKFIFSDHFYNEQQETSQDE